MAGCCGHGLSQATPPRPHARTHGVTCRGRSHARLDARHAKQPWRWLAPKSARTSGCPAFCCPVCAPPYPALATPDVRAGHAPAKTPPREALASTAMSRDCAEKCCYRNGRNLPVCRALPAPERQNFRTAGRKKIPRGKSGIQHADIKKYFFVAHRLQNAQQLSNHQEVPHVFGY